MLCSSLSCCRCQGGAPSPRETCGDHNKSVNAGLRFQIARITDQHCGIRSAPVGSTLCPARTLSTASRRKLAAGARATGRSARAGRRKRTMVLSVTPRRAARATAPAPRRRRSRGRPQPLRGLRSHAADRRARAPLRWPRAREIVCELCRPLRRDRRWPARSCATASTARRSVSPPAPPEPLAPAFARRAPQPATVLIDLPPAVDPLTVSIVVSAPREQVFDYLQDIANHPEFTDHYLVDWHLTRIDSVGLGRRRPFPRQGARQPFQLGRLHVHRGGAPAPHRRGRPDGQEQPHPHAGRLRAGSCRGLAPRASASRSRPSPAKLSDRLMEGLGARALAAAQEQPRDAPAARDPRAASARRRGAPGRRVTVAGG